jgi:hypothetical protein
MNKIYRLIFFDFFWHRFTAVRVEVRSVRRTAGWETGTMRLFWQRLNRSKPVEELPVPSQQIVRRVEITVEEDWVSGVVRRPSDSTCESPPDGEQPIATYLELSPGTKSK